MKEKLLCCLEQHIDELEPDSFGDIRLVKNGITITMKITNNWMYRIEKSKNFWTRKVTEKQVFSHSEKFYYIRVTGKDEKFEITKEEFDNISNKYTQYKEEQLEAKLEDLCFTEENY